MAILRGIPPLAGDVARATLEAVGEASPGVNTLHDKPHVRTITGWSYQFLEAFPPQSWTLCDHDAIGRFVTEAGDLPILYFGGSYKGKVPAFLGGEILRCSTQGRRQSPLFALLEHSSGLGQDWTRSRRKGEYALSPEEFQAMAPLNAVATQSSDYGLGVEAIRREFAAVGIPMVAPVALVLDTCDFTRSAEALRAAENAGLLGEGSLILSEEAYGYADASELVGEGLVPFWEHELRAIWESAERLKLELQIVSAARYHQQLLLRLVSPGCGLEPAALRAFFGALR